MPILKSAKKAMKRDIARRVKNDRRRRSLRENIKAFGKKIVAKDAAGAREMIPALQKSLDKAVGAGVIKKNTAARKKSRLVAMIKKLG